MKNYVKSLETQLEVINYFEDWLTKEMDWWNDAQANYEAFLLDSAESGFDCPVDSEEYFVMRNYIYAEIERQLREYHLN